MPLSLGLQGSTCLFSRSSSSHKHTLTYMPSFLPLSMEGPEEALSLILTLLVLGPSPKGSRRP